LQISVKGQHYGDKSATIRTNLHFIHLYCSVT